MSLKAFHFILIVASFALSLYFGVWSIGEYSDTEQKSILILGILSFIAAAGLVGYLAWFLRKTRKLSFYLFFLTMSSFFSNVASACPTCIGDPNSPMAKSANAGVVFLLGVTVVVLSMFASLFGVWIYRAKKLAKFSSLA